MLVCKRKLGVILLLEQNKKQTVCGSFFPGGISVIDKGLYAAARFFLYQHNQTGAGKD